MVLALDVLLGTLLIGAIALFATGHRRPPAAARKLGWALVLIPLPAAVGLHLATTLPQAVDQTLFISGIAAFALGAALLLGREDDDWREQADDEPPWWPEFEQAFREHARRRPMAHV